MRPEHLVVDIEGMSCNSCVAHVRGALGEIFGVEIDELVVGRAALTVTGQAGTKDLRDAVETAGYTVRRISRKDLANGASISRAD